MGLRKRAVFYVLFVCCISNYGFSNVPMSSRSDFKNYEHLYKDHFSIPWNEILKLEDQKVLFLLKLGLYQEAVWEMNDKHMFAQSKVVDTFLSWILSEGQVREIKHLGMGGASNPYRVALPFGVTGVFKPIKLHPSVNYKSEIAAYKLDRMLEFNLVPMTVKRTIKNMKGSIQYFVQDSNESIKTHGSTRSNNLNVFDYLISNMDRNRGNLLVAWGREVAIDHGLSFRGVNLIGAYLSCMDNFFNTIKMNVKPVRQYRAYPDKNIELFKADERIIKALQRMTRKDLKNELGKLLNKKKRHKIYKKASKLLKLYKRHQYLP